MAAARRQQDGLVAAQSPSAEAAVDGKPTLMVKLRLGKENAARIERKGSMSLSNFTPLSGEWVPVVDRPPTPPESISESQDSAATSNKPSPITRSYSISPTRPSKPEPTTSEPTSRRGSGYSLQSNGEIFSTEGEAEDSSTRSETPRKRRRLHRGLKERASGFQSTERGTPEASIIAPKHKPTFHTNEDLLAKFTNAVGRRQSEDRPFTTQNEAESQDSAGNSTSAATFTPFNTAPDLESSGSPILPTLIKHVSPSEEFDEDTKRNPSEASSSVSRALQDSESDGKATDCGYQGLDVKPSGHKFEFSAQQSPMIIDLEAEPEIPKTTTSPEIQALSNSENRSTAPVGDIKSESGVLIATDTTSLIQKAEPDQMEFEKARAKPPAMPEEKPIEDTDQISISELPQSPKTGMTASYPVMVQPGFSERKQSVSAEPSPMQIVFPSHVSLPPANIENGSTKTILDASLEEAAKPTWTLESAVPDREKTVVVLPSQHDLPFRSPAFDSEASKSLSPKKRVFPADDYLEQMVAHSKKSRTGSQVSESAYQNPFTPINNPTLTNFKTLPSQSPDGNGSMQKELSVPPKMKRQRKPKSQNPADLPKLAPAPFGHDSEQITLMSNSGESLGQQLPQDSFMPQASTAPSKPDIHKRQAPQRSSYPFLQHKRSQHGGSSSEHTASPPSMGVARPNQTPPSVQRSSPRPHHSPFQHLARTSHTASPDSRPAPQTVRYGPAPLPSPAESDAQLRPDLEFGEIFTQYPQQRQGLTFEYPSKPHFEPDIPRRHSTQVEKPPNAPIRPVMPHLNAPMPSQLIANGSYQGSAIVRQVAAPSQIYSAPMTPTEQFHSPQRAAFPRFTPGQHGLAGANQPFRGHARSSSDQGSFENGPLRHFIEQTKLHVYPPLNEDNDFEIVRLGAYSSADHFLSRVLSTIPEFAIKVSKLRVTFQWMPEGNRGRTMAMRLDDPERKEDAFKHICDEISNQFRIVGSGAPVTLIVDVVLK